MKGMMKAGIRPLGKNVDFDGSINERAIVPVCALAKDKEEVFIPGEKQAVNTSQDSPAMLILRSLRDESHRFALNAHRKRRSIRKSM